ncbi:MAG: hypothetical protein U9Q83_09250 [Bacteroidota bacterium]|nr:hypothetical protein [Bacteroidota bacterium]
MTKYELAIEKYEAENDDAKHKLIYAYFGLAVYPVCVLNKFFL